MAYSFSLVSGWRLLSLLFIIYEFSWKHSVVWWFAWTSVGVFNALGFACSAWVRVPTMVHSRGIPKWKFVLVPIIQCSPEFGTFFVVIRCPRLTFFRFCSHCARFFYIALHFISLFLIFVFILCCVSAFQSSMRVHGDNIYVRHSNLMLEVGTGVVWWLKKKTYMFLCILTPSDLQLLLYCTRLLPSRTLRLCVHARVCSCVDVC